MMMSYWVGVVEDRLDPLLSGRYRVRIHGYHNPDHTKLPVSDLPWAQVIMPPTTASMHGIGDSPTGFVEGTTVVGFFADGEDHQVPVIMGSLPGFPWRKPTKKFGFRDPSETTGIRPHPGEDFPRQKFLREPDVNRLARNQKTGDTVVGKKREARRTGIPIAFGGTWDQPEPAYNAEYPFNHVTESESGHITEVDDTKDNERLHWYHRKGTFVEIDANGTEVHQVMGDHITIVERNDHLYIRGKGNITIDGECNVLVRANCNLQVQGSLKAHANGNIELKAGGNFSVSAGGIIEMNASGNMHLNSSGAMRLRSRNGMNINGTTKTTIATPITEAAFVRVNGLGMTPIPPRPAVFSVPSTIGGSSVVNRSFPSLELPPKKAEKPPVVVTPITELPEMT